uniref:Uncharacterized protein n=1 Tax=Rhizophora mucronata TaxID=61149 RepID=A0A2P2PAM4_RHIMU
MFLKGCDSKKFLPPKNKKTKKKISIKLSQPM